MKKTRKKQIEQIQEKLIALMEKEGTGWTRQWVQTLAPWNIKSKKAYRGMNNFFLSLTKPEFDSESYQITDPDGNVIEECGDYVDDSPVWGTFKQWNELGYRIKKGSKASRVVFSAVLDKKISWLDDREKAAVKAGGKIPTYFTWKEFNVFNAVQVEGIDSDTISEWCGNSKHTKELSKEKLENIRKFVANTKAHIIHNEHNMMGASDGAYYTPSSDIISIPIMDKFDDDVSYYGTLLHELIHWTGAEDRLDRDIKNSFGSEDYAKEELVAEIGAAILCQLLGIETTIRANHAQYLNGWIKYIKEDSKVMVQAFTKATKAVDYLYSFQEEMEEEDAA